MKIRTTFIYLFILLSIGIGTGQNIPSLKPLKGQNVGDIHFNPTIDQVDFLLCDSAKIPQYYAVDGGYEGGRRKVLDEYKIKLGNLDFSKESSTNGYITIRFIVNCQGHTDRFRILQINHSYKSTEFASPAVHRLLTFVKQLKRWKKVKNDGTPLDYYQYLTFIVKDGKVKDIMP